ncbi:MAG: hypothetical protein R6V60_18325, partial [Desulfobacterales bacterium]
MGNVVEFFAEDRLEKGRLFRLPWTGQDYRGKLGYGFFEYRSQRSFDVVGNHASIKWIFPGPKFATDRLVSKAQEFRCIRS